jgi:UDP-N-acetylmuramoyl-L-alanyl-D-glutamate--2,6-diaminopimelate ligase
LAVYATGILLGFDKTQVLTALSQLRPIDGRFEIIKAQNITAIVDYAHTPDALEKILNEIRSLRQPGERIITVVGAGGNRDQEKRPKMGKSAAQLSDVVIFTSDNPRDEQPEDIIKQMRAGVPSEHKTQILEITDRRQAIHTALTIAKPGDIVLIAGKGHETYQEIKGKKFHFDDREVIKEFFGI